MAHDVVLHDRFFSKVEKTDSCWLWTASKTPRGYGTFYFEGRNRGAHRVAYLLTKGAIPEGAELDHLCRNPSCVNPDHLEPVTHLENTRRGQVGLHMKEKAARSTHCRKGHEYTTENTRIYKGYRQCRACGRDHCRRYAALARESAMRDAALRGNGK
jgi:hypothetical protein